MDEKYRASLGTDEGSDVAEFHDDSGEVDVGEVSFSFSTDRTPEGDGPATSDDGAASSTADANEATDAEDDPCHVAALDAVPTDGTLRCAGIGDDRVVEFIVRQGEEGVLAWRNSCPHQPEVPLDRGKGAIVTDQHLVCHEHGARFVLGDGFCSSGPCQGARLAPIEVTVEDDHVYLTDDRFRACQRR